MIQEFWHTPPKTNMSCPLKKGLYFNTKYIWTNHWFSGDMLVFGGVAKGDVKRNLSPLQETGKICIPNPCGLDRKIRRFSQQMCTKRPLGRPGKLGSKVRISGLYPQYTPLISRWDNPFTNFVKVNFDFPISMFHVSFGEFDVQY